MAFVPIQLLLAHFMNELMEIKSGDMDKPKEPSQWWLCPSKIAGIFKLVMNKLLGQKFAKGHNMYYVVTEKFSGEKW